MKNAACLAIAITLALPACASAPPAPPPAAPERPEPSAWTDIDSDRAADELVRRCLASGWTRRFQDESSGRPVVRVEPLEDRTRERIATHVLRDAIKQHLFSSGAVDLAEGGSDLDFRLAGEVAGAGGSYRITLKASGAEPPHVAGCVATVTIRRQTLVVQSK